MIELTFEGITSPAFAVYVTSSAFVNVPPDNLRYVEAIILPLPSCVAFVALVALPLKACAVTVLGKVVFPEASSKVICLLT